MPPKHELEKAYIENGLSLLSMGFRYGISGRTVKNWLIKCNIPVRTKDEQEALNRVKAQQQIEAAKTATLPVVQGQVVEESEAQPSDAKNSKHTLSVMTQDDFEISAFEQLTAVNQRLAVAYVDSIIAVDKATLAEIASRARASEDTLDAAKRDPTWRMAVEELTKPLFNFEGRAGLQRWVLERLQSGKIPQGELKVFAEMFGLIGAQAQQINIAIGFQNQWRKF